MENYYIVQGSRSMPEMGMGMKETQFRNWWTPFREGIENETKNAEEKKNWEFKKNSSSSLPSLSLPSNRDWVLHIDDITYLGRRSIQVK